MKRYKLISEQLKLFGYFPVSGKPDAYENLHFIKHEKIALIIRKYLSIRYLSRANAWEIKFGFIHNDLEDKYRIIFQNVQVGEKPLSEMIKFDDIPYWSIFSMNIGFSRNITSVKNDIDSLESFFQTTFLDYLNIIETTNDAQTLLECYLSDTPPFGLEQTSVFHRICEILHLVSILNVDFDRASDFINNNFFRLKNNSFSNYATRDFFKNTLLDLKDRVKLE